MSAQRLYMNFTSDDGSYVTHSHLTNIEIFTLLDFYTAGPKFSKKLQTPYAA